MAALTITGTPPVGVVGQPYSWSPTVSGGTPPYTYTAIGAEAAGLAYDPIANVVSGIPTTVETISGIVFMVTDSAVSAPGVPAPATAVLTVSETVTGAVNPPTLTVPVYDPTAPAITGAGLPGAIVVVSVDGAPIFGGCVVGPKGTWRHPLGAPLNPYVTHTITAAQYAFGAGSSTSPPLNVAISAIAPPAPVQPPALSGPGGVLPAPGGPISTPQAPTLLTAPVITGALTVGQTLSISTGAWTGSPTGYAYQWKRGATVVSTAPTYTQVVADTGVALSCTVTATNAIGSASATTTAASATAPLAPAITAATATTVTVGSYTAGATLTVYSDGVQIATATAGSGATTPVMVSLSGSHSITATQTVGGVTSAVSSPYAYSPAVQAAKYSPLASGIPGLALLGANA